MAKPSLNYYQALHVGKVKTDVIQYTSIQSAIDAITDNATGKRYAVYVHPGTYSEKITMEDYVDLIAVGGREETIISYTNTSHDEATLTGENSCVRGFTIISDGGGARRARCVSASVAGFEIENCILTPQNTAVNAIALNASASCDIRDSVVDSASAATTGALFTTAGQTYNVERTKFDAATDAIQVTTTPTLNLTDCTVSDNFNQDGGTVNVQRCQMEAIDLGTAVCSFSAELSRCTAGLATAGAFAHTVSCIKCSFSGQNFNNAATGATTITLRDCDGIATLTNAGVGGTVTLYECGVETVTTSQGTVTAYGGRIGACGGSTGTRFIWWKDANFLEVLPTMKIAHALAIAASGDVIHISKGTFAESNLAAVNGVDIVGEGSDISIIEVAGGANPIIDVGDGVACALRGIRVSNTNGAAVALRAGAGAATVDAQDCEFRGSAATNIVTLTTAGAGAPAFTASSCIFRTGAEAITVTGAVVASVIARNSTFATCTLVFSTTGANHTFSFNYCHFGGGGVTLTANVPVVTLTECEDIGTFTHNTASTVTLNHCRLSGGYTTGAVAAIVTAYATTFAAFTHAGTGAITLDNCGLGAVSNNSTATMTIRESHMGNLTQAAAAGTINVYNSSMGDISTGATGTIRLEGGCRFTDISANAGVLTWKVGPNHIKVVAGTANMKVADALTLAVAGDVIELGQGTFAESNLAAVNGVDIIGEGWGISVIETTDNVNPIIAVGNNVICEIHRVKISNLGTGGAIHIEPVANSSVITLEECWVTNSGAGDAVVLSIGGAGNAQLDARRCDFVGNAATSIVVLTQTIGAGLLYFNSWDCNFDTSGGAANAAIEASAAVVAAVNVYRATFVNCTLVLYSTGANHTIGIEDGDFNGCGVGLAGNVPTVNLTKCNNIGAFAHSVACTVTLRECYLSGTYTIAAVAGVVNAYRTQFSTFTNGGSGAIAFQECNGTDINNNSTSTMTIEGGHWDTVLQAAAAGTINIYEAVVATEFDCSAGGAINAYNCDVADIDSNGGTVSLYEGDLRAVSDATGVITWKVAPHTWRVISSTANMKIMDAADAAAVGDTILIGPGTFTEALDLDAAVNACTYKGFGRGRTIITQPTGTTVLVDGISGVVLEDLRIELTAGVNTNAAVKLDSATNASASVTLRNVGITTTWTAGTVYGVWAVDDGVKVGLVLIYDSTITCSGGANSYAVAANTCTTATTLISIYDSIIYGQTYDIYNDRITITTHKCELNGAGWWIQNNASAIGLAMDNENPATVTPVTFAGAAGEFADLTGAELYTCAAGVLIGEAVYVSAGNTVAEATNVAAAPVPAEGVVIFKPAGAAGTECYVKNSGMLYMATPPVGWVGGTNVWLGAAGAQLVARPTNALKQLLGVGVDTKRMLINIAPVEVVTEWMNIPIAWGAGSAPTGTHIDGNSRRAVAIVGAAGQTVFSQAAAIPENYLAFSKLYVSLFPTTTGTFDWTAYSSAAKSTEDEATHSDTATADGQAEVDDQILDHDISGAADGYTMEERDIFSAEFIVDVLTTTTQINVLGFRLEYTAQRGA